MDWEEKNAACSRVEGNLELGYGAHGLYSCVHVTRISEATQNPVAEGKGKKEAEAGTNFLRPTGMAS
jgi:hypothetical protein